MPASKFASEVEMMEPLVDHFRGNARDLRQNLPVVLHGDRLYPDLVVIRRETGDIEVFEGKLSLTDEVMNQARRWGPYCNRSYVVVPEPDGASRSHRLRRELIRTFNLGLIYIRHHDSKPEFQHQFNLYRNPKPDPLLLAAMEQAPPSSTDKPAGAASVQPSAALQQFKRVIAFIERNGEASARELELAGVLRRGDRMRLIRAIQFRELPQLVYTGPHGVFQRSETEVTG